METPNHLQVVENTTQTVSNTIQNSKNIIENLKYILTILISKNGLITLLLLISGITIKPNLLKEIGSFFSESQDP